MKSIICFKEKHGDRCFDASTSDLLNKAALKILKERFEEHWYNAPQHPGEPPAEWHLTKEQFEALPTENLKNNAIFAAQKYTKQLDYYNRELKVFDAIKRCIEQNDGELAYRILCRHRNGEYEDFEIIKLETVE